MAKPLNNSRRKPQPRRPERLVFEDLEPRVLLSADPLAVAIADSLDATAQEPQAQEPAPLVALMDVPEVPRLDGGLDPTADVQAPAPLDLEGLASLLDEDASIETRVELIFLDPRVDDYQQLVDGLAEDPARSVEVIVLDADRDGIEQMSEALVQRVGIDAVHVISHGTASGVQIGGTWLTVENLSEYRSQISAWASALDGDADLLLYGCDLAGSAEGVALVEGLADLAGIDVAASDDLTGSESLGGDWELEHQSGKIESEVVVGAQTQRQWSAVLATGSVEIAGKAEEGETLEAIVSDADGTTTATPSYLWQRSPDGTTWQDVGTDSSYLLDNTDVDQQLRVQVSYTDDLGMDEWVISEPTVAVFAVDDPAPRVFNQSFAIDENTAEATFVGRVEATDPVGGAYTKVYWADYKSRDIYTANIDGSTPTQLYKAPSELTDLAVDWNGNGLFWVEPFSGALRRLDLVTDEVTTLFEDPGADPAAGPLGIELDLVNGKVYWTDTEGGQILRANLDGSDKQTAVSGLPDRTSSIETRDLEIDLAAGIVYWVESDLDTGEGSIRAATLEGTLLPDVVTGLVEDPYGLALDPINGKLYWTELGKIGRVNVDGTGLEYILTETDGLLVPEGIEVDVNAGRVFWVDYSTELLQSAAMDGSDLTDIAYFGPNSNATVSSIDLGDPLETLSYSIVAGNIENAFSIDPHTGAIHVATAAALDFETTPTFDLTVEVRDTSGNFSHATITVALSNINEAPTALALSSNSIDENVAAGTTVGTFSASDPDTGDTFTYALVAGTGDTDNAAFTVVGNQLQINISPDFETQSSHSIRLSTTDAGGLSTEQTFIINVNDLNEAPIGEVLIDNTSPTQGDTLTASNTLADPDGLSGPISYHWHRNGIDIPGATGASYTTTQEDVGSQITVEASYTDDQGTFESVGSAPTAPVVDVNVAPIATNLNQSHTYTEGTASVALDAIVVSDGDSGQTITATLTLLDPDAGTLTANSGNGENYDAFSGLWRVEGSVAQVNAALAAVAFEPYENTDFDTTIVTNVVDQDGAGPVPGSIQLDAVSVNDAPVGVDDKSTYTNDLQAFGPIGYWRLGDSGSTAVDAVAAGNDGTYQGGVVLGQPGAVTGDLDKAAEFDGSSGYVELSHSTAYELSNGTVQFWFNADSLPSSGQFDLFSKDHSDFGTGGHLTISLLADGSILTRLQSDSDQYVVSSTPVAPGAWHYVAFTFGSQGMELYVDGVLQDTDIYSGGLLGNSEPLVIGAGTRGTEQGNLNGLDSFFDGKIDEVAIFDSQLTGAELRALYDGGLAGYQVAEDGELTVPAASGVLGNDFDVEGDPLTAVKLTDPANGTLALNPDGSFTYTPNADFNGVDSFTYMANDGTADGNPATVHVAVTPINDAPSISLSTTSVSYVEDSLTPLILDAGLAISDRDDTQLSGATVAITDFVSGDTLTADVGAAPGITADFNAGTGVLTLSGNADVSIYQSVLRTVAYSSASNDPTLGDTRPERSVSWLIVDADEDGAGWRETAGAESSILVAAQNDAPTAILLWDPLEGRFDSSVGENVDSSAGAVYRELVTNDPDGGDTHTYAIVGGADAGLFTLSGNRLTLNDGVLDHERQASYEVKIRSTDAAGLFIEQTLTLVVNDLNDAPVITSASGVSTPENDTPVTTLSATDQDGDLVSYFISGGADGALFAVDPVSGELSFVSAPNYESPRDADLDNRYEVIVSAGDGVSSGSQLLSVSISDAPDAPSGAALGNTTVSDQTDTSGGVTIGALSAIDEDAGDTASFSIVGGADAANFRIDGSALVLDDGVLDVSVKSRYEVVVRVTDSTNQTVDQTLTVNVEPSVAPVEDTDPVDETEPVPTEESTIESETTTTETSSGETAAETATETLNEETTIEGGGTHSAEDGEDSTVDGSASNVASTDDSAATADNQANVAEVTNFALAGLDSGALLQGSVSGFVGGVIAAPTDVSATEGNEVLDPVIRQLVEPGEFVQELDEVREQVTDQQIVIEKTVVGSTVVASTGLSVGYVLWLVRGGVLVSSLLSSLPAWRLIDPLPVLAYASDDDDDQESLETLVKTHVGDADKDPEDLPEQHEPRASAPQARAVPRSTKGGPDVDV